ncbi:MAG: hypothetical protein KGH52_03910, partial [Candidatus Micrarchaeota archaeon]|nr:hypothetical protein [Candidatus Micrarchaeota archaeon]
MMPAKSAQSVTEYLSTYSWAILAASAVVIVMFALGVFNSPIPIQSCILVPGYICSHPILTDSGILSFNLSYVGQTITVTGIGCNSGNLPPASLQSANFVLTSNKGRSVTVACPISSNAFGTGFQGHLWLQYNTQTQSNLESDIGVILGAVNTRTSTSTTSTSTTSTSSTSSTTTSSTSTTSSSSTSSSSTSTTTTTSTSTTSSSSTTSTSTSTTTSSTTTIPTQNPTCGYFLGDAVYSSSVTLTCNVITSNAMLIQSGVTVDENGFYMQANSLFTNYGTITDSHDGGNGGTGGSGGSGGPGTASAGNGGNSGSARTS